MLNVSEHIYDIGTEVLIPIRHHFNGREFHNNLKLRSPAAGSIFSSKLTSAVNHEGLVCPLLMFHFTSCFGGACEPKTRESEDISSPSHQGTVWIREIEIPFRGLRLILRQFSKETCIDLFKSMPEGTVGNP